MAGICCGIESETTSAPIEPSSRTSRRRRLEILPTIKCIAADHMAVQQTADSGRKRQKLDLQRSMSLEGAAAIVEDRREEAAAKAVPTVRLVNDEVVNTTRGESKGLHAGNEVVVVPPPVVQEAPRYGSTSVCGRRRDMEDAVSIHPTLCKAQGSDSGGCHFYGVYDGHGCSHVALKCKDRLHEIVKQHLESQSVLQWKDTMERSFSKMDEEVHAGNQAVLSPKCRCELQTPQCDAVGSTAVVAVVTPEKIIVSNCGDSRAVLCRSGAAVPLSSDHKPDRPDELLRIEAAGGRVIYWDGPRVLGVLAMSRAIGDNYLKPYVIPAPEVTITERTAEDECLILASDGLWDVVSNDTACGVVRMCMRAAAAQKAGGASGGVVPEGESSTGENSDKACADASILLTKLALARQSSDNVSVVVVDLRRRERL
ncbi:protein phosphatase 2C 37-like [Argentina anserina]|uniref:protein phosphatase 2C 37-like n=1 Tax=Argentina anserina TaxID=57926 RepID=UPI0021762262|nr:protein phosphatase 2C 37-like [Potentilla anserina]